MKSWPRKNLGELLNFLDRIHPEGLSLGVISSEIGMTVAGVSNLFMMDDMKLSKAEGIAKAYGYELHLFFPVRNYSAFAIQPSYTRTFETAGNLEGLARYIYDSNWTINSVAHGMRKSPTMLSNAIRTGDILLSNLYKVTDSLGIYFFWKFEKIKN